MPDYTSLFTGPQIDDRLTKVPGKEPKHFVAVFDETPFADILAAHNAGKMVICEYNGAFPILAAISDEEATFSIPNLESQGKIHVTSDDEWTYTSKTLLAAQDDKGLSTNDFTDEAKAALNALVADGYLYAGVVNKDSDAPTATGKVFVIASTAGTYTDFDSIVVNEGEVAILKFDGTDWSKEVTGIASKDALSASIYFTNLQTDANKRIKELYLLGTDPTKKYYFKYLQYTGSVARGRIYEYTQEDKSDEVHFGRFIDFGESLAPLKGIVPIMGGGAYATIKGYAVLNLTTSDTQNINPEINLPVASNLDFSPSIKAMLNERLLPDLRLQLVGRLVKNKAVSGYDGELVNAEGVVATDFISVEPGDEIRYTGGYASSTEERYSLVSYDANFDFVNYYRSTTSERTIILGATAKYIRATFKKDYVVNTLYINNNVVELQGDIVRVVGEETKEFPKIVDIFKYNVPINVFGDVLPSDFRAKLMAADKDLLIACQGDSVTGFIERCSPRENPEHCPAGQQYAHWVSLLQYYVSKNKPICDRLDSQRDSISVFTKTGTWQNVVDIEREAIYGSDGTTYGQERSLSALTFQSSGNNASIGFEFNADTYEKCNLVFSKEPDAVLTKIIVAEGNGKMLVSEDRENWVEANGFQYNQRTFDVNGDDYTTYANLNAFTDACRLEGIATRQRHRRLWMRKADGVTGTIHINYTRDNSIQYDDSYMYMWGIEQYSGTAIFFDNIGRGGRDTDRLSAAISDVFDRNPDLAIYEMPLANETNRSRATLKSEPYYGSYFVGDDNRSFKVRSANYTTLPLIILLPHGRADFFDEGNNSIRYSNQPEGEPVAYAVYKQMYGWLWSQMASYDQVRLINLYDQIINEILAKGYTIKDGTQGADAAITPDGIHLNDLGSQIWAKYLIPIFQ